MISHMLRLMPSSSLSSRGDFRMVVLPPLTFDIVLARIPRATHLLFRLEIPAPNYSRQDIAFFYFDSVQLILPPSSCVGPFSFVI